MVSIYLSFQSNIVRGARTVFTTVRVSPVSGTWLADSVSSFVVPSERAATGGSLSELPCPDIFASCCGVVSMSPSLERADSSSSLPREMS